MLPGLPSGYDRDEGLSPYGEAIPGWGPRFTLIPMDWVIERINKAFGQAAAFATQQLIDAGAERPLQFKRGQVLAQYYPERRQLLFIFTARCRGGLERADMSVKRYSMYQYDDPTGRLETMLRDSKIIKLQGIG